MLWGLVEGGQELLDDLEVFRGRGDDERVNPLIRGDSELAGGVAIRKPGLGAGNALEQLCEYARQLLGFAVLKLENAGFEDGARAGLVQVVD
jgi:hypothetical protein